MNHTLHPNCTISAGRPAFSSHRWSSPTQFFWWGESIHAEQTHWSFLAINNLAYKSIIIIIMINASVIFSIFRFTIFFISVIFINFYWLLLLHSIFFSTQLPSYIYPSKRIIILNQIKILYNSFQITLNIQSEGFDSIYRGCRRHY